MAENRIPLVDSLRILKEHRGDAVVVTAMGVSREWMALGEHPLDFNYVPSSMGQGPNLALGIALAQPQRRVIACNGDGSTLMNLGALVTLSAAAPPNLTLILFDNSVYEVTGAQGTPGTARCRADGRNIDYADIARACGIRRVETFDTLSDWQARAGELLTAPELTCVVLKVAPVPQGVGPRSPGPAKDRARAFAKALQGS